MLRPLVLRSLTDGAAAPSQGESTKFAENYTLKMAGEHMFHGKSGKYLRF